MESSVRLSVCQTSFLSPSFRNEYSFDRRDQLTWNLRDKTTLLGFVKSCGKQKDLRQSWKVHSEILQKELFPKDICVGNAIISMYAKCGALEEAREVFDELQVRNIVSWNALISGYSQHGLGHEAIDCFIQMKDENISPNAITFACILKACGSTGALEMGEAIHAEMKEQNLEESDVVLGTALVDMYAKCGFIEKAQGVWNELPTKCVESWNALITGYAHQGDGEKAIEYFWKMQDEGLSPDVVTFVCVLKACSDTSSYEIGQWIHNVINKQGFLKENIQLGTALVSMYGKCGLLEEAHEVFDKLPMRNVASWNALITGYVQHRHYNESLDCFIQMQNNGIIPDIVTFNCILKVCANMECLYMGEEIHAEVKNRGLLEKDPLLGAALVDMYAKCNALGKAQQIFDKLPICNIATWNALIGGYMHHNLGEKVIEQYNTMKGKGIFPDSATFVSVLQACSSSIEYLNIGEVIHAEVIKVGALKKDVMIGTTLIDMYGKYGLLEKAQEVFDELPLRNIATWNSLISGYFQNGFSDKALKCFVAMQDANVAPDAVTYLCILKGCSSIKRLDVGEEIHTRISKERHLEKDVVLATALLDMYAKCGMLDKMRKVFDQLFQRSVICWNALITGYSQHSLGDEALYCFKQMLEEGMCPDAVTFICILKSCAIIGALEMGEEIHAQVYKQNNLLAKDFVLGTSLVDMYVKCGKLSEAQKAFCELPVCNVTSWTALMAGFAQHGEAKIVFGLFIKMIAQGVSPNVVTFTVLLCACTHAGLVEEGQIVLHDMEEVYCLPANVEQHTCMVDLFSRAGILERAITVIDKVSSSNCLPLWRALLGACQWANVELGRFAFQQLIQLDKNCAAAYIWMGNIYVAAGLHVEAGNLE